MSDFDFMESAAQYDSLKEINRLCTILKDKRKNINYFEEQLKKAKEEERELSRDDIPNLLLSKGIKSVSLTDGSKVTIEEKIHVSLPKKDIEKRRTVLKWIIGNGGSSIIKRNLNVEDPESGLINFLKEHHIIFEDKKDIHASTLKAWFSSKLGMSKNSLQEIEIGDAPIEAGLFVFKETKIK